MNRLVFVISGLICSILIGSCNMPASPAEDTTEPEAVHTWAAETIIAQLTQITGGTAVAGSPTSADDRILLTSTADLSLEPTETPQPAATRTPIGTPTTTESPTSTTGPADTDPRSYLGEPDWEDRFSTAANWSLYEDEYVRFRIKDNLLIMVALEANGRDSWMLSWPQPDNFYLEMTAQSSNCSGLDRYGLIFRSDAEEGYLAGISCDGRYSLRTWNGDKFSPLIAWTDSETIQAGSEAANRLGVMVVDNDIQIYINGFPLASLGDADYEEGGFGVYIGALETDNFRVEVDRMAYWELP